MRLEKLPLKSFDVLANNAARRPFVPPSLVPEDDKNASKPNEPPPPTFSESDLKATEQEGYRKGFLEGVNDGIHQAKNEQADIDRALTDSVAKLASNIAQMIDNYNRFSHAQAEELTKLSLTIARKVAGRALDTNPLPLVESVALECVSRILGEPHIIITVNDTLSDALEERLIAHFAHSAEPGEISIHGDRALSTGDCRIEWGHGSAERNTQEIWADMEKIVHEMIMLSSSREIAAPNNMEPSPIDMQADPRIDTPHDSHPET